MGSNTWNIPFTNATSLSVYPVFFSAQNPAAADSPCIAGLERLPTTPDDFDTICSSANVFSVMVLHSFFVFLVSGPACYLGAFFQRPNFPQTNSVDTILTLRSELPLPSAWPAITHHFNINLTLYVKKRGCSPALPPVWDIVKVNKSYTVCGSYITYAPNIPGSSITIGASKSTWSVEPLFISA